MKTIIRSSLAFIVASCLFTGCCTPPPASAWEYQDLYLTDKDSMNKAAKDGWIVVSTYYDSHNHSAHYIVKRLKK